MNKLNGMKIGFAVTGSFCTFSKAFEQMKILKENGAVVIPVMSLSSCITDTRFGNADDHIHEITRICGVKPITNIVDAEPVGPKNMTDIMVVAPCTGNTLAKLAYSITDTPATMAVKSHLRNSRPVVINISTNDALAGSLKNIGYLMNTKNYFFVPFSQDNYNSKPSSLIGDFSRIPETILAAADGKQIQPVIL
ncbi:MAG: dipicolinate synthase subunit B [Oscillospiraceae bacterium]|nr:dipicolinate synthase subunit B [Oscillospiraceae bacterium]